MFDDNKEGEETVPFGTDKVYIANDYTIKGFAQKKGFEYEIAPIDIETYIFDLNDQKMFNH